MGEIHEINHEITLFGRAFAVSPSVPSVHGTWRYESCANIDRVEATLIHHGYARYSLSVLRRADNMQTDVVAWSGTSPEDAEAKWLAHAREHAPSLYEIMAAETARTVTLFGRDARADIEGIETRVGLNIAEAWGSDVDGWAVRVIARDADLTETQRVTARGPTLAEAEQAWLAHASLHAPTLCAEVAPC